MDYEQSDKMIAEQQETNRLLGEILKIMQATAKCDWCGKQLLPDYVTISNKLYCSYGCAAHETMPQPN